MNPVNFLRSLALRSLTARSRGRRHRTLTPEPHCGFYPTEEANRAAPNFTCHAALCLSPSLLNPSRYHRTQPSTETLGSLTTTISKCHSDDYQSSQKCFFCY
ncbi:hypothetical protein E2C01_077713 [Portunus trituberculatus]|uniref:Uncharacterized protein n=1 Tax=Portunus trituberculatus TaxID=210409 RepID=A0A5B7IS75_PORTR|nr:hypothetical protein [Portunus trituberculatus]